MKEAGRILVVDDDEAILEFVRLVLEDEGYEVIHAMNGLEALEKLEEAAPGLILLDMRMPGMNGWQFAEAYRKRPGPHAPIAVVTAAHDAAQLASEVGAHCHLGKPFDVQDLIDIVHSCIRNGAS